MDHREFLVVGAGVSGLAFANEVKGRVLVVEREAEAGGYCRTVKQDGFVWDYSGHFFHFRHPDIEAWLRARMPAVRTVQKRTRVRTVAGDEVDFPFQTHLHQLPQPEFIACLGDLFRASRQQREASSAASSAAMEQRSFRGMLEARFGRAICERFLVPYNEKLYATDLDRLDKDAMGRFFPHASLDDALAALAGAKGAGSYNDTFTYPEGGAVEYIRALLKDLAPDAVSLGERVESLDLDERVANTNKRAIRFEHLVTSAPLPSLLRACGVPHDESAFSANQVLVFNLGFDKKGRDDVHWLYFADPSLAFYRVGFYDNILGTDRMSLYVELGMPGGAPVDVDALRARVLADLSRAGIIQARAGGGGAEHELVSWHHVVMNPAYVHITQRSIAEAARTRAILQEHGVHSIGRYGAWTYCSIEDNIVEARALARALTS